MSDNSKEAILLSVDYYEGANNHAIEFESPSNSIVAEQLQKLDGGNRSSLCIEKANGDVFCVGGGPTRFHISVTVGDDIFLIFDSTLGNNSETLVIGAIKTPIPSCHVVDRPTALKTALHFIEGGTLDESLQWKQS